MKYFIPAILFITAIVFGSLYVAEHHRVTDDEALIATLRTNVTDLEARVEQQEQKATTLQTRLQDTRARAVAKADEVEHLEQVLTNRAETTNSKSNPMAEMFKNPEMKELIKNQQKAVLSGMVDKNYASFFSGMNLTPAQSATLKDLVIKKSLIDASAGISLMSGDTDASKRQELML